MPVWSIEFLNGLNKSDLISLVALVVAVYAAHRTYKFAKKQDELAGHLIEKEKQSADSALKADLGARIIKIGKNYRVKVFNKGDAAARNVRVECPTDGELLSESEIDSVFPLEVMEPSDGVDLVAFIHMRSRKKHELTLIWDDDSGTDRSKTVYLTR